VTSTTIPTTVVIPTVGRPSLRVLLDALVRACAFGPSPDQVIIVDDRPVGQAARAPLEIGDLEFDTMVVSSDARGPAAARNRGWRLARTAWVSFLDDDVVPEAHWLERLAEDLVAAPADVAGSQGQVDVPLPDDRRPTDWERGTAGLASACWITADMSFRRRDLAAVGGFDERFPRAFREDAELALRLLATGRRLTRGRRRITHPVRPVDGWVSVRVQRGNADDVLMTRLHGSDWWDRADAPRGRRRSQRLIAAALAGSATALLGGRRLVATALLLGYVAGVAEFARARIAPGPRTADEVGRMALTSPVIPIAATWHWLRGLLMHRSAPPWHGLPDLVLFDRDGTLVHDVPYNDDPSLVRPVEGAVDVLDALRDRGIRVGVVSNQSGVGNGRIAPEALDAVNAEVERRLGPFDVFLTCPHTAEAGCDCRKPEPGMIVAACRMLDAPPEQCVVVGDIATDVVAARRAGARGILVPNDATASSDLAEAGEVVSDLREVLDRLLDPLADASHPPHTLPDAYLRNARTTRGVESR
jgi:HAD superfamily hydrolase (TIGR01662 family)